MKRILSGIVILIAVLIGGQLGREGYRFLSQEYQRASVSTSDIEESLLKKNDIFRTLKAKFPSDFQELVSDLTAVVKSRATVQEVGRLSADAVAKIRRRYAPQIALAPDEDIRTLIQLSRQTHSKVLQNEGWVTCSKFGMVGYASLVELKSYVDDGAQVSRIYFEAVAKAIENPIARREPSDEDWISVGQAMVDAGAPDKYLEAIATPDVNDPELCPALIAFMDAILTLPGGAGERIRSNFAKGLAEG